jgi:hypothetical protein
MVRAKFVVTEKTDTHSASPHGAANAEHHYQQVRLTAVYGDDNKSWSKWTPSGSIQLQISNPEAYDQLKLGQAYFVDFTPAPAKEADEKK